MSFNKKPSVPILLYALFLIQAIFYYISYVHESVLLLGMGALLYFLVFVAFGTIGFILVYNNNEKLYSSCNNMFEVSSVPTTINIAFLVINLLFNTFYVRNTFEVFILDMNSHLFISSVLINCILIAIYVALISYAQKDELRVVRATAQSRQNAQIGNNVGKKLDMLIAMSEDEEVKTALLEAKEMVMYTKDRACTGADDAEILQSLNNLENSIEESLDAAICLQDIAHFKKIWHRIVG